MCFVDLIGYIYVYLCVVVIGKETSNENYQIFLDKNALSTQFNQKVTLPISVKEK